MTKSWLGITNDILRLAPVVVGYIEKNLDINFVAGKIFRRPLKIPSLALRYIKVPLHTVYDTVCFCNMCTTN